MSTELILPGGGEELPYTRSHGADANTGAITTGANNAFLVRYRVPPRSYSSMLIYVTTQNGNIDVGIYQSDGVTLTKLQSSGATAVAAGSAYQTITFTAVPHAPGVDYYLALACSGTAALLGVATVNAVASAMGSEAMTIGTSYPLPATITLASCTGAGKIPSMLAS